MTKNRIYIPEATRVKQIRNAISDEYQIIYYDNDSKRVQTAKLNVMKYKAELRQIRDEVTQKYLTITPDQANLYTSIEQYAKDKYNIDNLFTYMETKLKKPTASYGMYTSPNYIKLIEDAHIEIMYSNIPNTRNVVMKSDIDDMIYKFRILNEYYNS